MVYFLIILAIALSIVKANGWILVPNFCVVVCWIFVIVYWFVYSYAITIAKHIDKKMAEELSEAKNNVQSRTTD